MGSGATPPETAGVSPPGAEELHTDLGNARRLVARHGDGLRYVPQWKAWLVWDGARWVRDECELVAAMAKETIRALYRDASTAPGRSSQELARHALRSENLGRLAAMTRLAQSEPGVPVGPDALDADPWLLSAPN